MDGQAGGRQQRREYLTYCRGVGGVGGRVGGRLTGDGDDGRLTNAGCDDGRMTHDGDGRVTYDGDDGRVTHDGDDGRMTRRAPAGAPTTVRWCDRRCYKGGASYDGCLDG